MNFYHMMYAKYGKGKKEREFIDGLQDFEDKFLWENPSFRWVSEDEQNDLIEKAYRDENK